jgi:hypothetical protein
MIQTFDTDTIIYKLLKDSTELTSTISGGVYVYQRPFNSVLEDVVVNTIVLSQDSSPQIGTSNVNIHVKDKSISIGGLKQDMANIERLKEISAIVLNILRTQIVPGLSISIENQTTIPENEINQHYVNIRINWNIHI